MNPQFVRNYGIETVARDLALKLDLKPDVVASWDSGLWRGPRILVPIHVEALVVENAENGPWADMRLVPEGIPGYVEAKKGEAHDSLPPRPGPFTVRDEPRAPGVYLHWSLPDALTQGTVSEPVEEVPPTMEDVGGPPQPDLETDEDIAFPLIPDRWLVARTSPGTTFNGKRRVTAWVIESEEEGEAAVTPWFDWEEDRSDTKPDRWMTVLGEGDPAYMAYYDNVENILGFYDDLNGINSGPLTYTVMGWYSRKEDDPLFGPQNKTEFMALLEETLNWSVGDDSTRLQQAAEAAQKAAQQVNLGYDVVAKADYSIGQITQPDALYTDLSINAQPVAGDLNFAMAAMAAAVNAAAFQPKGSFPPGNIQEKSTVQPHLALLAKEGLAAIVSEYTFFRMYWPRQMLCHGTVFDVRWRGQGGQYDSSTTGIPKAGSVKVAVGNTGMEALAAALAQRSNQQSFERLLKAYHYGLLPVINDPDGVAVLESLLHAEDFASKPGGYVVDVIEEGALFPRKTPAEKYAYANYKTKQDDYLDKSWSDYQYGSKNQILTIESELSSKKSSYKGAGQFSVNREYVPSSLRVKDSGMSRLYEDLFQKPSRGTPTPEKTTRKMVPFRRALPRYWEPKDPAILVIEAHRSYKHGEDGRFSQDGKLACRVTGDPVTSVDMPVTMSNRKITATDLCSTRLISGQLPKEINAIFGEALLLDTSNGGVAAQAVAAKNNQTTDTVQGNVKIYKGGSKMDSPHAYEWMVTQHWNTYTTPGLDDSALLASADVTGVIPSLIGVQPWRKPWTPLHLEWRIGYYPSPGLQRDWLLKEHEYEHGSDTLGTDGDPAAIYEGRTLLTPAVSRVVSERLSKFLDDERNEVTDLATDAQEKSLAGVLEALEQLDVLATSLAGLHDAMIGIEDEYRFEVTGIVDETPDDITDDDVPIFPVRAGHYRLLQLRVVDAFGQIYEMDDKALNTPYRASDVEVVGSDNAALMGMPPRILQPTRAMFRMLDAADDAVEASKTILPICGWLLPDHLDEALEIFDSDGISQGQVQLAPDGRNIEWQGVPGNPAPLGAPPDLANTHLSRFIDGLLGWGVRDKDATDDPAQDTPKESALSAMLRMIDATLWTVDPMGREGDEHLSVLVGRPLAMVRAELRLELEGDPLTEELARTAFPFRLGAVNRLQDGLMGYFVNDDYEQFFPVHESIAAQTRPSGPNVGFLGPIQDVPNYYLEFGQSGEPGETHDLVDPVDHPYINVDPVIRLRPGQKVRLTLLVDPRGGVHLTSGLLPRKRIDLLREHVAKALDNIIITFRVGPVLTDPEMIRMPLPAEIRGRWNWVRRTGPTVWQEDDVTSATDDAILSDQPTEITEGWLKLSGTYIEEEEDASP